MREKHTLVPSAEKTYNLYEEREDAESVPSAGKHAPVPSAGKTYADAKRGKANDLYQEREDAKPVPSAGKPVETKSRLIFILLLTG